MKRSKHGEAEARPRRNGFTVSDFELSQESSHLRLSQTIQSGTN